MTTNPKRKSAIVELKALLEDDEDRLRVLLQELLQELLEQEMTQALAAAPSERTPDRAGYRAGHYPRSLVTRVGKLELRVPRDREGRFSTELFERYQRSEQALVGTLAEMYIQGVSTRKVKAITEELCGDSVSASTISRINKRLDKSLTAFAERELDESMPYLIVDARYEKVREAFVEAQLASIRSDPKAARRAAETMRAQASREMASEMAAAALVADPGKLQDALRGETVDVALSSISLLTPDSLSNLAGGARSDERTMLNHQAEALGQLAARNPVELRVRDDLGVLRTVQVNVQLRQFNFGVNAGAVGRAQVGSVPIPSQTPGWRSLMGWGFAMERNNPQLERLLGAASADGLGGDVADRLFLMRHEAEQLAGEVDDIEDYIALQEGEDTSDLDEEAAMQRAQLASLNKRIESLDSAAQQAKAIWASNDYRRGGGDPFKMVSRLALVGHLMGETPLFNCKSGKDRTGQLDAEVKFLATAADESGGRVPEPDQSMEAWRPVRNDFVFNTGNLEMQRLNTGLPGYKLKGVPRLANVIRDGMKPLYRGGSAHVSA